MCGEIEDWQTKRQVTVRLTTSAANQSVKLPFQFLRVEEIRLNEAYFSDFNGGTGGITYLNLKINSCNPSAINNDNNPGTALAVDVLSPHKIYQNPRQLQVSPGVAITDFQVRLEQADGALTTFTECLLVLTFVMRKSASEVREYREAQALMDIPQMKGIDPRTTFQGRKVIN